MKPASRAGVPPHRRDRHREALAEDVVGGGARGRYTRKKKSNPLPLILGGVGGLVLLGVVLFFMFGGDSIDVDNATPYEKMSYYAAFKAARLVMQRGKELPDIDEAIAKIKSTQGLNDKFSEEYFRVGWNDGVKGRDPKITLEDIPNEFRR